ncbi:hypothetical protein BP6252_10878 [Coleophoma cylindrospora]|uniref:Zn(2)-C6 fungal-type domain-containing protein n=1 Tax=Coleophoma cylindrospora TaxID=1849047 RepID=A0A3D8QND1_9HELO|nr:hypothetical protein BP6252_10878 [Coleophoma cylindrospora]
MDNQPLAQLPVSKPSSSRQPVSCEQCRQRKIKCSRTRAPCDSCRRRRIPDSCYYAVDHGNAGGGSGARYGSPTAHQDLLARISHLEEVILRQAHGGSPSIVADSARNPLRSQSTDAADAAPWSNLSSGSSSHEETLYSVATPVSPQSPPFVVLATSLDGNIHQRTNALEWNSVFANTRLAPHALTVLDEKSTSNESGFPFTESQAPNTKDLIGYLPPTQQTEYLKNKYFEVFSPLFHVLHDPSFHMTYAKFTNDPSSVPPSWLAILFILLSLAVSALGDDDPILKDLARGTNPSRNIQDLAKRYRDASMKCLSRQGVFWGRHNLQSLQALIMLGYAMSHCQENTWVLLGMTHHVAIALACNIDPDMLHLDHVQSEERRRCWAALMMLYTIQSTAFGNLNPLSQIPNEVTLPADVNDIDITPSGINRVSSRGPTQMSYLLFKFRLYNIAASICTTVFSFTKSSSPPDLRIIQSLDRKICLVQESWDARYQADISCPYGSPNMALPIHHQVHLHILHGYAHQLFLLLHRPFFAQSILGLEIPNASQIRCIASAEALLDIHRILCETPTYRPFLWYTYGLGSFHAFHAAAVLAVACLVPSYSPQWARFTTMLKEVLARFEAAGERSIICVRAARVVKLLMNRKIPLANDTQTMSTHLTDTSVFKLLDTDSASSNPPVFKDVQNSSESTDDLNHQLKFFAERMQPQQWLGPNSMAWNEWDECFL